MRQTIEASINANIEVKKALSVDVISQAASALIDTYQSGGKLLICGNGGSAADAQHIAAELVGRYLKERPPVAAIALSTNTSSLTAIGNDYGYDVVFERQVEAFGAKGDILIGISTSGNSENIVKAFAKAKELGITTIAFTGRDGGKLGADCDIHVNVPSQDTPRVQESHILVGHILCDLLENALFPS